MTPQASSSAPPAGAETPGSIGAIRDRSVREAVERTRDVIRRTREMLAHSRELLERVRQRTAAADVDAHGEHPADDTPVASAGADVRTVDGRA